MRKKLKTLLCVLILAVTISLPLTVDANNYNEETVFDYADLLTSSEEDNLRNYAEKFEKYDISVIFLTTNDAEDKSSMIYSDDFYDSNNFRPDGVLFMIDMDNRELYINTVGECIDLLTDTAIYNTLDACYTHASNGEYALCLSRMSKSICTKLEDHYNPLLGAVKFSFTTLIIMVVITIIIVIVLISKHNRANKSVSAKHYIGSTFEVKDRNVVYMGCSKEVIRDYYAPSNNSSGGGRRTGGSSHRSSRGVRHGGGGRKF